MFMIPAFTNLLLKNNIEHKRSRPYNPQANGMVERFNGTFGRTLNKIFRSDPDNFQLHEAVRNLVNNYNNVKHTVTRFKPSFILKCTDESILDQVRERNKLRSIQTEQHLLNIYDPVVIPDSLKLDKFKKNLVHRKKSFRFEALVWRIPGRVLQVKNGMCKIQVYCNYFGVKSPLTVHNNFLKLVTDEEFSKICEEYSDDDFRV